MERFSVLKSLPPYGDLPEQFSSTGQGKHREGFVVEFHPANLSAWVGNFQRGSTKYDQVLVHPNPDCIFVIAGGEGYVVNINTRKLIETFGGMINGYLKIEGQPLMIHNNGVNLIAYEYNGRKWSTKRISWDGIQNLRLDGNFIIGEGWDVINEKWSPFKVDVNTGEATGGGYEEGPIRPMQINPLNKVIAFLNIILRRKS